MFADYKGTAQMGKAMHYNVDYNAGLLEWYYTEAVPLNMLFNQVEVAGNRGVARFLYPIQEITEDMITEIKNDCDLEDIEAECLQAGNWDFELNKEFKKAYKAFECSLSKLESEVGMNVYNEYIMDVENRLTKVKIKMFLKDIAGKVPFDVTVDMNAQPDIIQAFSEFALIVEEKGYSTRDFITLITPRVSAQLKAMNIACCNLRDLRGLETMDNELNLNLVVIRAEYFPTGFNMLSYIKKLALYATTCKSAKLFEPAELKYQGWLVYYRYEQFDFEYMPTVDYMNNLPTIAGVSPWLGYLGFKANITT